MLLATTSTGSAYFIVNLEKAPGARTGIYLRQSPCGVVICDMDPYPSATAREWLEIGDTICSVNGKRTDTMGARRLSRTIVKERSLSLCIHRLPASHYFDEQLHGRVVVIG